MEVTFFTLSQSIPVLQNDVWRAKLKGLNIKLIQLTLT